MIRKRATPTTLSQKLDLLHLRPVGNRCHSSPRSSWQSVSCTFYWNKEFDARTMAPPTALGTLNTFPREIRDTIYGLLLGTTYVFASLSREETAATRLAILYTSKAVSEEAVEALYSQGIFRFIPDFCNDHCTPTIDQRIANKMKNIEIVITMSKWVWYLHCSGLGKPRDSARKTRFSTLVAQFGGNDFLRNSCRIKFHNTLRAGQGNLLSCQPFLFSTSLFQRFKGLRGFKSVVIEFHSPLMSQQSWIKEYALYDPRAVKQAGLEALPPIPCKHMPDYMKSYFLRNHGGPAADIHQQIRTALEPALGVSTEGAVPDACNVIYARCSEFRPLAREANTAYGVHRLEEKRPNRRRRREHRT